VSPEELRQMQREAASQPSLPWPQAAGHGQSAPPREGGHGQPGQRDGSHGQGGPRDAGHGQAGSRDGGHGQGGPREAGYGAQPEGDMPTRRVRPEGLDYGRGNPVQPPPYIPAQGQFQPDLRTKREPFIPGAIPGQALQRSAAYGVASAMLLVIMIVLASFAPVVVAVLAIPVAVLLRAADLAQPELRATGAAALDVIRVFAFPKALAKSAGITLALFLYALILGLPVTLLLAVVAGMSPYNALAWGSAVALWTVCAGPGVEGPGRQMRRTLSSLVPSRTAAMVMAGVLAAGAVLSLILAVSTFGDNTRRSIWAPVDVGPVVGLLNNLKGNSGG
jgi:hypothetical protein